MLPRVWTVTLLVAIAAVTSVVGAVPRPTRSRRTDQDFEFDEDMEGGGVADAGSRRGRRYLYDPHNVICRSLVCNKHEVCVLRDAYTPLCINKKDLLKRGDSVVATSGSGATTAWSSNLYDDDVFYEEGAAPQPPAPSSFASISSDDKSDRCVGCPSHRSRSVGRGRSEFLCGSDNRTYSSLCRLDLHNCVRRPRRPVSLACRGFCPCLLAVNAPAPPPVIVPHRPRVRQRGHDRSQQRRYHEEWRRMDSRYNEVVPIEPAPALAPAECALDEMANRLLDWFSVLMEEARATSPPLSDGFPSECKPEVRWMFAHLDVDGDGLLSALNLYSLRHDERERCLRPFLSSCGSGDADGGLSRVAWCGCLRRASRPCTALARAHPGPHPAGAYVPRCDSRGYYRARQCHAALGVCWCVDPHGVETPGSRTKGVPSCVGETGGEGDAPSDDEDGAGDGAGGGGSGDHELHY